MNLFSLWNYLPGLCVAGIGMTIHEFLRNNYPQTYFTCCFYVTYNTIYFFSLLQTRANQLYKSHIIPIYEASCEKYPEIIVIQRDAEGVFNHFLEWYNFFTSTPNVDTVLDSTNIDFIKHGDVFFSCSKNDLHSESLNTTSFCYDFIIDNHADLKRVYTQIPSKLETPQVSNVSVIFAELTVGNAKQEIRFSDDSTYNYLVVGNVINKDFMLYFIRQHYLSQIFHSTYNENMYNFSRYTLKIIDGNVNIFELGPDDSITIGENGLSVKYSPPFNEEPSLQSEPKSSEVRDELMERLEELEHLEETAMQDAEHEKKTRHQRKKKR